MTNDKIEEILNDFDQKFSKISHMHRGECVITDSTGTKFQAHEENGKVTEVGGLESIKDFIRAHFTTFAEEIRKERVTHCDDINCPECHKVAYEAGAKAAVERVMEWLHEHATDSANMFVCDAVSAGELLTFLQKHND